MSDHLGSTSIITDASGNKLVETKYKPWGEVRATWTNSASTTMFSLNRYTFTGQYSYMDDLSTPGVSEGFGLMFYNARWYDPYLNRFAQADSIIPSAQGVQAWDRYAYVNNSPVNFTDPSGHEPKYGCYDVSNGKCVNADKTPIINGNGKGGGFLNPWDVSLEERQGYIETVATRFNIKLPPGDNWSHYPKEGVVTDTFNGFKVFDDHTLSDGNPGFESLTYITNSAFRYPYDPNPFNLHIATSITEFASFLAHEGEHSWQNYYYDNGTYNKYPQLYTNPTDYIITHEFSAVAEADAYTVQKIFLETHGVNSGTFYDIVSGRANQNITAVNDLYHLSPGNGTSYSFPLSIYYIIK